MSENGLSRARPSSATGGRAGERRTPESNPQRHDDAVLDDERERKGDTNRSGRVVREPELIQAILHHQRPRRCSNASSRTHLLQHLGGRVYQAMEAQFDASAEDTGRKAFRIRACLQNAFGLSLGCLSLIRRCSSVTDFQEYAPSSRLVSPTITSKFSPKPF